jgi:hypothetical protein
MQFVVMIRCVQRRASARMLSDPSLYEAMLLASFRLKWALMEYSEMHTRMRWIVWVRVLK